MPFGPVRGVHDWRFFCDHRRPVRWFHPMRGCSEEDRVRLDARLAAEGPNTIAVLYRLDNDRPSPIEVLDVLLRIENSGVSAPDMDLAYVLPEGPEGVAVGKYLAAEPEDREIEAPEVVLARRVAPGASVTGRMLLTVPLMAHHPYARVVAGGPRRVVTMRVLLGFIDLSRIPPGREVFRPYPQPGLSVPMHGDAMLFQEILSVTLDLGAGLQAAW